MHSTTLDFKDERTLKNPYIMECSINQHSYYTFSTLFNKFLIEKNSCGARWMFFFPWILIY
jgi:hypothetical protein